MVQEVSRASSAHVIGRYLFVLVEQNNFATPLREELHRQVRPFAAALKSQGSIAIAMPNRQVEFMQEVLSKSWPDGVLERLYREFDPALIVVEKDWQDFDPSQDSYAIVWITDVEQGQIAAMLHNLAMRAAHHTDDLIEHLRGVADRTMKARAAEAAKRGTGWLARLASYIELKPQVFGVTIDLQALLRDISELRDG